MGAMGGALGARDTDRDHKRKYQLSEEHDVEVEASPSVITAAEVAD